MSDTQRQTQFDEAISALRGAQKRYEELATMLVDAFGIALKPEPPETNPADCKSEPRPAYAECVEYIREIANGINAISDKVERTINRSAL